MGAEVFHALKKVLHDRGLVPLLVMRVVSPRIWKVRKMP